MERAPPINMESSAGSKRLADSVEKNYHELVLGWWLHLYNYRYRLVPPQHTKTTKLDQRGYPSAPVALFIIQLAFFYLCFGRKLT